MGEHLVWITVVGEALWVVGVTIWLVQERRSPQATLAWIFALTFLPFVGVPVYLFLGPRRWTRKCRHLQLAREFVRERVGDLLTERVLEDPARLGPHRAQLVQLGAGALGGLLSRAHEIELYFEGADCYEALFKAIRGAKRHVHVECYIFEGGTVGKRLRDLLAEKAREGVRVRLLMDTIGSRGSQPRGFLLPLVEAGAKVAWFNPVRLARIRSPRFNFRTHRKIVVVDSHVGFVGGMNICDYHTSELHGERAWRDTHLKLRGATVTGLQLVFLENWHFVTRSVPTEGDLLALDDPGGEHLVQIVASGPDNDAFPIHKMIFASIAGASERVLVTTPYFVPDEAVCSALVTAALRGVDVRILVPAMSDSKLVTMASRSYYEELLQAGVRIHHYEARMLHAKTMVVDSDLAVVGSANLDNRSFRLNFEIAAFLYSRAAADELAAQFELDLESARAVGTVDLAGRSFAVRLFENAARLFAPQL